MSLNVCTFSGRIGKDAELRYTADQKAVANFPLAVTVGWGGDESTLWVKCALWGSRGEKLAEHLVKGLQVSVTGSASVRGFKRANGEPGASLQLSVRDIALQGGGKPQQKPEAGFRDAPAEDDIPF
jgi:single-strand DNA-binding protein